MAVFSSRSSWEFSKSELSEKRLVLSLLGAGVSIIVYFMVYLSGCVYRDGFFRGNGNGSCFPQVSSSYSVGMEVCSTVPTEASSVEVPTRAILKVDRPRQQTFGFSPQAPCPSSGFLSRPGITVVGPNIFITMDDTATYMEDASGVLSLDDDAIVAMAETAGVACEVEHLGVRHVLQSKLGIRCVVDTAATIFIISEESLHLLQNVLLKILLIRSFHGATVKATKVGSLELFVQRHNKPGYVGIYLPVVWYVPGTPRNLFSWPALHQQGGKLNLEQGDCYGTVKVDNGPPESFHITETDRFFVIEATTALPRHISRAVPDLPEASTMEVEAQEGVMFANAFVQHPPALRVHLLGDPEGRPMPTLLDRVKQGSTLDEVFDPAKAALVHWNTKIPATAGGLSYDYIHILLGHPSPAIMKLLPAAMNFSPDKGYYAACRSPVSCDTCQLANIKRQPLAKQHTPNKEATGVGNVIHTDIAGPYIPPGLRGEKYIVVFIDECSRFAVVYAMQRPGEMKQCYLNFLRDFLGRQGPDRVHLDNAAKLLLGEAVDGVMVTTNIPGVSHQNAKAERMIQTLLRLARALQETGGAPECFFINSLVVAGVLLRFWPSKVLGYRSPYQIANAKDPGGPMPFHPLYCRVTVRNPAAKKNERQGTSCILIGYAHTRGLSAHCGAFQVLDIDKSMVLDVAATDCVFDETYFPFKEAGKYIGDQVCGHQPGRTAVDGTIIMVVKDLATILLADGQLITIDAADINRWREAYRTKRFSIPAPVPSFPTWGMTSDHERKVTFAEPECDDGTEEMKASGDPDDKGPESSVSPPALDNILPGADVAPTLVPPTSNASSDSLTGLPLAGNSRKVQPGDNLWFPAGFFGSDPDLAKDALGTCKQVGIDPSNKTLRKKFPGRQFMSFTTFWSDDSPDKAVMFDAITKDVNKYAKILSPDDSNALAFDDAMVLDDGSEAWAALSEIDSRVPEYGEHDAHTRCDEVFCWSAVEDNSQFTGLGYTHEDRKAFDKKLVEAFALEDFIKSLNVEQQEKIKTDSTPDPATDEEADKSSNSTAWADARDAEIEALVSKKVLQRCTDAEIKDLKRRGVHILSTRFVYKSKLNAEGLLERRKVRLVVRGFSQIEGRDFQQDNVKSPTVHSVTVRALMAMAVQLNRAIDQWDVANAFMQGTFIDGEELYVELPKVMRGPGDSRIICKLLRPLYGLKQAAQDFYNEVNTKVTKFGFVQSSVDACLWTYSRDGIDMYLIAHVDDILCVYDDKNKKSLDIYESFSKSFAERFHFENNGPVHYYLGMEVIYDREKGTLSLVQTAYIKRVLARFGMGCGNKFRNMPTDAAVDLAADPSDTQMDSNPTFTNLREVVGCLIYASTNTRPDISYAVSALASHVTAPAKKHHTAAMRILKYLAGTLDLGITYTRVDGASDDVWRLYAHSDADYAQDTLTRRSRSGKLIMMCGGPMIWGSFLQNTIALSSTESEYTALVRLVMEICYFLQILFFLKIICNGPMQVFCDNESTIRIATDRFTMRRTRHVQVKCLKIKEWIDHGIIKLLKVPTENNLADWFTKGSLKVMNFIKTRDIVMSRVKSSAL